MSNEHYTVNYGELQGAIIWSGVKYQDKPGYFCVLYGEKSKERCDKIAKLLNEDSEKGQ